MSDVTANAASSDTTTEIMAATKNRPRMVATNPEMSISSRPIRKKRDEDPDTQEEREFVHRMDYSGDGPQ